MNELVSSSTIMSEDKSTSISPSSKPYCSHSLLHTHDNDKICLDKVNFFMKNVFRLKKNMRSTNQYYDEWSNFKNQLFPTTKFFMGISSTMTLNHTKCYVQYNVPAPQHAYRTVRYR